MTFYINQGAGYQKYIYPITLFLSPAPKLAIKKKESVIHFLIYIQIFQCCLY